MPKASEKKFEFTERGIAALKPADPGKRYEKFDTAVQGLGVVINGKPKLKVPRGESGVALSMPQGQFIYYGPAAKGGASARRTLGQIIGMSLADARKEALRRREMVEAGLDLREEAVRAERAEADAAADTFGAAMEVYLSKVIDKQRRGEGTRADIERDLLPFWRDRPLRSITKKDVRERMIEISEGRNRGKLHGKKTKRRKASPRQARVALGNLRTFFHWAEDRYDLETLPTDSKGLNRLVPAGKARQRLLSDDEVFAFWKAAGTAFGPETDQPLSGALKLLLLTGARLNEIFEAERRELNEAGDLLTIPAERFKSDAEHLIPLSPMAREVLASVPRYKDCKYLFSRDGKKPAKMWSKDRARLETEMLKILKAQAVERSHDPDDVELKPFVLHDLRRVVRTKLSALGFSDSVSEMVIGHGKKGLQRVYDLYKFQNEIRAALDAWADTLRKIIEPAPSSPANNVIPMRGRK